MTKEIKNLLLILCGVVISSFLLYKFVFTSQVPQASLPAPSLVSTTPMILNTASPHSFSVGPENAKVTVVEFFDPECESCSAVAPQIKNEMKYYEGKVRWVFRYMAYHFNSKTAIQVLEAARKQNLFLETQQILFENQKTWGEQGVSTKTEILKIVSNVKKLNMAQLKKDMQDPEILNIIAKDASEGEQAGVKGTPTFFVNGVKLNRLDLDLLIQKINAGLN